MHISGLKEGEREAVRGEGEERPGRLAHRIVLAVQLSRAPPSRRGRTLTPTP